MSKTKIIPLVTIASALLLTACSSGNKTLLSNFTGGVKAPNAYESYRNLGLQVPADDKILKPNIKNNYLLQLSDIQRKVISALLLDESKNIEEDLEPAKIVYLNKNNVNPNKKNKALISENSTKEEEILFDDKTLFTNKKITSPKKQENKTIDIQALTSIVSTEGNVNNNEILNSNFIDHFKDYILYDENTKFYQDDLLTKYITTNNTNRLKFFRLLDAETDNGNFKKGYLLYKIGLLSYKPVEYILDASAERQRIKKLKQDDKKLTGYQAPMYITGDNNTTFIGGYLKKVGIHTLTPEELSKKHFKRYHHKFKFKK